MGLRPFAGLTDDVGDGASDPSCPAAKVAGTDLVHLPSGAQRVAAQSAGGAGFSVAVEGGVGHGSAHPQRGFVHLEHRLFFGDVIGLALAQGDDLAHDFGVVATRLGLGHHLLLLVGDLFLFRLEAFEPFDELP